MIEKSSSSTSGTSAKQTLVEEGTHFKGSLASNCPVVVRGKIEGDVAAPSLNVAASGSVHGVVKVTDLRSAGELLGDIEADTVQLSGVVKDKTKLRAKSLEVRLAVASGKMQVVFGDCTLDVGEPITKEEAIRIATQGDTGKAGAGAAPATEPKIDRKEEAAPAPTRSSVPSARPSAPGLSSASKPPPADKGDDGNGAPTGQTEPVKATTSKAP